jgi:von Willebrand factor type A domain
MSAYHRVRGKRRCGLVQSLFLSLASPSGLDMGNHWITSILLGLCFVLQLADPRHASAAPPRYRVGACLSAKNIPMGRKGETTKQYYQRVINELEHIAGAIARSVPAGTMDVKYILKAKFPNLPAPRVCAQASDEKRDYDIWLELIYEENETFVYEVNQQDHGEFKMLAGTDPPWPDATQAQTLLAAVGQGIAGQETVARGIVGESAQPAAVPVEKIHDPSKGIIFVYDSSGSMQETDHGARNRLGVEQTIGEFFTHTAEVGVQPIPFAIVVFEDKARTLESKPGSPWFETTPDDLQAARTQLQNALKDIGNTNIEAAFNEVAQLMNSRQDVERWHIVFLTDGAPTAGTTDYQKLKKQITTALGGKSTLSVIALHGSDPTHTEDAKLAELVRTIVSATGQSGELVNLKAGDHLEGFRSSIDRIAFLINGSTIRDEAGLECKYDRGAEKVECELDKSRPHALRFGAAQKVTFIADTTALPGGKCTAKIQNQGLGPAPLTIELPEGQPKQILREDAFEIVLSRSSDRVFLAIEMTSGRVNGDWQVGLTMDAPAGRTP